MKRSQGVRPRHHCNGDLPERREIGLNPDSNKDKWVFIAKKQGGGQWMTNYSETASRIRGSEQIDLIGLLLKAG